MGCMGTLGRRNQCGGKTGGTLVAYGTEIAYSPSPADHLARSLQAGYCLVRRELVFS